MKKCEGCGSTDGIWPFPAENPLGLFCKRCAEELIKQCLEAHPEHFVRLPNGNWSLVEDTTKH